MQGNNGEKVLKRILDLVKSSSEGDSKIVRGSVFQKKDEYHENNDERRFLGSVY